MSVTLTSDPIVDVQTVRDMLKWTSDDEAKLAINSVSERFLRFTNRLRITSGTVTERQRGRGQAQFWLHATPITSVTSVTLYSATDTSETIASGDYTYNATSGHVYSNTVIPYSEHEENLVVVYVGGWTTVPGDIVESALALMRLDKQRRDGLLGVTSQSREGFSASYEPDDLPRAIAERWKPWRFLV